MCAETAHTRPLCSTSDHFRGVQPTIRPCVFRFGAQPWLAVSPIFEVSARSVLTNDYLSIILLAVADYLLRGIDDALWQRFKARAATEGRGLKFVVLRLVELYTEQGLQAIEEAVEMKRGLK